MSRYRLAAAAAWLMVAVPPCVNAQRPVDVARFHAGLPRGETFFVTALLRDSVGHREQLFVAVDSVVGDRFVGRIWSQVILLVGYHLKQPIELSRTEIVDWMISKPDGTEEGNALGKFIETYTPPATCPDTATAGGPPKGTFHSL